MSDERELTDGEIIDLLIDCNVVHPDMTELGVYGTLYCDIYRQGLEDGRVDEGECEGQLSEEELRQFRRFKDTDLSEYLTVDEARERLDFD